MEATLIPLLDLPARIQKWADALPVEKDSHAGDIRWGAVPGPKGRPWLQAMRVTASGSSDGKHPGFVRIVEVGNYLHEETVSQRVFAAFWPWHDEAEARVVVPGARKLKTKEMRELKMHGIEPEPLNYETKCPS